MPMKIEPMPSEAMIQEEIRYCLLKAIIEAVEKLRRECGKPMPSEGAALVTACLLYTSHLPFGAWSGQVRSDISISIRAGDI